jgi:chromosome segregation ATPase
VIAKLKEIAADVTDDAQEKVQQLVDEYNKAGHVPFKDKDKIYKEFHDVLDKIYNDLHISVARRRLDNFKSNLKNMAKRGEEVVDNERSRLMRRYEQLKQEITTYENNLGFLNISSKKGNSLVDEMNRKVQKLKDDAELGRQKIKAIDRQADEEEANEES